MDNKIEYKKTKWASFANAAAFLKAYHISNGLIYVGVLSHNLVEQTH